jgi:hypothetical protein
MYSSVECKTERSLLQSLNHIFISSLVIILTLKHRDAYCPDDKLRHVNFYLGLQSIRVAS